MHTKVPFVPSDPPFFDFFVTSQDSPEVCRMLTQLGAHRLDLGSAVLYTVGFEPRVGDVALSGVMRTGRALRTGPGTLEHARDSLIGQYCALEVGSPLKLRTDFLGSLPVYYDGIDVSNRLHLLAEVKRARGTYQVDEEVLGTLFVADNSFSMQTSTFRTAVRGVRLLPAGSWIEVGKSVRAHHVPAEDFEQLTPYEYWRLIEQAAEELTSNVAAALNSAETTEVSITAGRDSRATMAAVIALGRINDVRFSTMDRDDDVPMGSGLVKHFGGQYGSDRKISHWVDWSVEERIARRRSCYFGQYHLTRWKLFPQVFPVWADRAVQLTGGLGEIYRSFYQKEEFARPHLARDCSASVVREMLSERQWVELMPGHIDRIAPVLAETFEELPGKTMDAKLGAHYLNFRSRMHFGLTTLHRPSGTLVWNPLASPSLLRAARGLPPELKNAGRALFDVTRVMCEELAHMPYGKPIPDFWRMPYHRPSQFDGKKLELVPAPEIVRGPRRLGPPQPKPVMHDMDALVRRSILEDFAKLPAVGAFFTGEQVESRVRWIAAKAGIRSADAMYSKLDAIVHCWAQ